MFQEINLYRVAAEGCNVKKEVMNITGRKKRPSCSPEERISSADEYTRLKKGIVRCWRSNQESAFLLYDKLLVLHKKERESTPPRSIDREQVIQLAEQMAAGCVDENKLQDDDLSCEAAAYLKESVDQFQWRDNEKAIRYARAIVHMGEKRGDMSQQAMGLMALGDSIAIGGKNLEMAWKLQRNAADLFLQEGNLIGWARTTIGRVAICIEMQCIEPTLKEAINALGIFKRYEQNDFFVRLSLNIMRLLGENGQYRETLVYFKKAHPLAISLKEKGAQHLGLLYINAGTSYLNLGEFNAAYDYFTRAREILTRLNKVEVLNHILSSIANIENIRGNYREALGLWNRILAGLEGHMTLYAVRFRMRMAECYLNLNRDQEAGDLARTVIGDLEKLGENNGIHLAHGLRCLGMAEAKLGLPEEAQEHLSSARDCYSAIKSQTWIWMTELLRGKIFLKQGDYNQAIKIARESAAFFRKNRQSLNLGDACRLQAECFIGLSQFSKAMSNGKQLLKMGKARQIAHFCYEGYFILGKAEEGAGRLLKAGQYYIKAVETIEELQKNLTITIRPGFLEDKCEAGYALIRLFLQQHQDVAAFEALERLKSLTMLASLTNRRQLFWSDEAPGAGVFIEELNQLRKEYNALLGLNREKELSDDNSPGIDPLLLSGKMRAYEKKIRHCIEKLYLINADRDPYIPVKPVILADIQQSIPENTCLLEYFMDRDEVYVFIITGKKIDICSLPVSISETGNLLEKYFQNINYALQEGSDSSVTGNLARLARSIGKKLFDILVKPAGSYIQPGAKLIIVPFGLLHYIPFNTLYNGKRYFIEENEISILPSSAFLTRPCQPRAPGMVLIAHTHKGKLPFIRQEAEAVGKIFRSRIYLDEQATQQCLQQVPVQILHMAAHGKHDMDQPDLSAIRLEDGFLYADDLLQHDLGYELVTLSACETGRTAVKKSEELIGLIRGVLFAGAQSVAVSMWRVDDETTTRLMINFYSCLQEGKSRAAALREAQLRLLEHKPGMHPAYWGAFQLVGFTGPLSSGKQVV